MGLLLLLLRDLHSTFLNYTVGNGLPLVYVRHSPNSQYSLY